MKDGNPKRIEEYTLFDCKRNRGYKTIENALDKMNEINENKQHENNRRSCGELYTK